MRPKKDKNASTHKYYPVFIVIFCSFLTTAAQTLLKYSTSNLNGFYSIITNIPLILGLALYGITAILLIIALKHGELSLLYPFAALSFIWTTLVAIFLFNETVSIINWIGIMMIIIGISFIGRGLTK